ncbi:MAG: diiron oxygenase [Sandaracinaceae bacterium]|nr:diiron oxygenase [Sandaracinaceae bacterium]
MVAHKQLSGDPRFGDLHVGQIADSFGLPEHAGEILHAAFEHLHGLGVDLVTANQSHPGWVAGYADNGFVVLKDRRLFCASPELEALLQPFEQTRRSLFLTNLMCHGPHALSEIPMTTTEATSERTPKSASDVAVRLTKLSRERSWNVYTDIAWPEALSGERYCMAPELMSIWGTEHWDTLTEEQRVRLSLYECANFFSLTLQGERPLVAGLSDRLYSKRVTADATEYLHHFLDEENKHMVMFGMFLNRYVGKVYPEKKVALDRTYAKGEEEVMFFCKALVVEELGDYYNMQMMGDQRIEPIVRELNDLHHRDESRHIAFGRLHLRELSERWLAEWPRRVRVRVQTWLARST